MKTKIIYSILILLLPIYLLSQSDDVLRVTATGKSAEHIIPKSKARAMALRAATLEAYRKIAEKAGLAAVTRTSGLEYKQVQVFLKGARVIHKKYISDHEAEVVMEIPVSQLTRNVKEYKSYIAEKQREQLKKEIRALEMKISILQSQLDVLKKKLEKTETK
jgi:hypothetical protein